jgi:CO/xanthine dehydrogenase Mo-binding subunit
MPEPGPIVGASPIRKEGLAKVTGRALYVDDITLPGMWYGATVRSTIARGRIASITFDLSVDWSQFTIVTAADIPGENTIVHLAKDHPCLAAEAINHQAEPILLLAHPDKAALPAAVAAVHIEYQELPGVFTIEDSELGAAGDQSKIIWHGDHPAHNSPNTFKTFFMQNSTPAELEAAFAAADFIVGGEYRTGAQEQLYIENNGVIAEAFRAPDGTLESVTVSGSMQCPYYLVHALSLVFGLPQEKCRVIQTETGGAFGGKEDFPSVIGSHAALLAMKSGHPVKICYDRAEDLIATTKRHPSRTRHRTAVSRDGKILAGEIDIALDGGAYATLSPVVLSRATIHAPGAYLWPHIAVHARAMATNTAPHGAFRGFGAPQSLFALERHMDKIARVVGLSPEELRRRNFLSTGDHTATGQHLSDPVDMLRLLTRALKESDYHARRAEFDRSNPASTVKRGIGFAAFMHGSGFTGSGERRLNSIVRIELTFESDARPRLLV